MITPRMIHVARNKGTVGDVGSPGKSDIIRAMLRIIQLAVPDPNDNFSIRVCITYIVCSYRWNPDTVQPPGESRAPLDSIHLCAATAVLLVDAFQLKSRGKAAIQGTGETDN